ncbi:cyclic amp receptor 2 [Fusarium langsethiae]|uniref:Cyclic amp receptor 2 n=1 Tax=Fusarium langsethiae TaxID=179993 RepID=A0A0M9ELX8_FUSLA|nr:cyclic amp receptor 2 [Fusarium langsethiae]GKU16357.1 unnamed protein product [Fusarium langsethiae]
MLASSGLDESARLDRFLLLLQFGARVEQKVIGRRGPLQDFNIESQWDSGTTFSLYIRSCRPATIPTIIREIADRLYVFRVRGCISDWTLRYCVGTHTPRGLVESAEAENDCMRDENVTAVKALREFMSSRLVHFPRADFETDPLIPGSGDGDSTLPHGWKRICSKIGDQSFECFEDDFTQSITLERPKMSLYKKRQVQIGLLQQHPSLSCHLDLVSCMRAGVGQEQRQTSDTDLRSRFPDCIPLWMTGLVNRLMEASGNPNSKTINVALQAPTQFIGLANALTYGFNYHLRDRLNDLYFTPMIAEEKL